MALTGPCFVDFLPLLPQLLLLPVAVVPFSLHHQHYESAMRLAIHHIAMASQSAMVSQSALMWKRAATIHNTQVASAKLLATEQLLHVQDSHFLLRRSLRLPPSDPFWFVEWNIFNAIPSMSRMCPDTVHGHGPAMSWLILSYIFVLRVVKSQQIQ